MFGLYAALDVIKANPKKAVAKKDMTGYGNIDKRVWYKWIWEGGTAELSAIRRRFETVETSGDQRVFRRIFCDKRGKTVMIRGDGCE